MGKEFHIQESFSLSALNSPIFTQEINLAQKLIRIFLVSYELVIQAGQRTSNSQQVNVNEVIR